MLLDSLTFENWREINQGNRCKSNNSEYDSKKLFVLKNIFHTIDSLQFTINN